MSKMPDWIDQEYKILWKISEYYPPNSQIDIKSVKSALKEILEIDDWGVKQKRYNAYEYSGAKQVESVVMQSLVLSMLGLRNLVNKEKLEQFDAVASNIFEYNKIIIMELAEISSRHQVHKARSNKTKRSDRQERTSKTKELFEQFEKASKSPSSQSRKAYAIQKTAKELKCSESTVRRHLKE